MPIGASLRDYARRTSRAVAFSAAGAIFLMIGFGFLTVALWLMLVQSGGTIFAAQVVGVLYLAVGFIFFAIASFQKRRKVRAIPPRHAVGSPDPVVQMIEGFLMGLDAGRRSFRSRRR